MGWKGTGNEGKEGSGYRGSEWGGVVERWRSENDGNGWKVSGMGSE